MSLTDARVNAALDTSLATSTHMQLHTGDPGAAGTTNVAAGISRQSVTWGAASTLTKSGTSTFTIPGAGGPFTHVSFWSASSGGTYNGSAAVSPAEAFAGAGTLAVTAVLSGQSS